MDVWLDNAVFVQKHGTRKVLVCESWSFQATRNVSILMIKKNIHTIQEIEEFKSENVYINPFARPHPNYFAVLLCESYQDYQDYYNLRLTIIAMREFILCIKDKYDPESEEHREVYNTIYNSLTNKYKKAVV